MFFIAGITGHVGGAAARQLLIEGHKLRTLARDPQKAIDWVEQGVDVRHGDWTDADGLASALEGIEAAFVMVPPNMTPQPGYPESKGCDYRRWQGSPPIATAASGRALVHRLGANQRPRTDHCYASAGAGTRRPWHSRGVRPRRVVCGELPRQPQGCSSNWVSFIVFTNHWIVPVPTIATEDIGQQVAKLLSTPWQGRKNY